MEAFIQDLHTFEAEHSWWSPETFLRLENQSLKDITRKAFEEHADLIQRLTDEGTVEDMVVLETHLQEKAPKMIIVTLACFLDILYKQATDYSKPISKDIVAWYRQKGWQFPEFPHEVFDNKSVKIETITVIKEDNEENV
jgi:hypothetical protein